MAGDFDVQPLGTVVKVRSGYAFKSEDMGAVGLPVIKIKNVVPPTVDITDCERVPEEVISSIPRVERFELKEGDTLIAMTGATVGKVGKFPRTHERHFLNQRVGKVYLTEPDAADYRYIYYILSQDTYVRQMFGIADGSAQANISGSQIESLEVPLPPLAEQKAIAAVLGALDDKIELNRRMNATLEAMARALFQSWFVDFDPVRLRLSYDGQVRSKGSPPNLPTEALAKVGLTPATAALFPDSFQDSELGHIPKGWRACTLGDIAKNVSITFDFKRTPEVVFINTGDVLEGDFLHANRSHHAGLPGQAKKSIRPDDILFSEIRPANKRYAYVDFDSSDYVVSTKFMIIRGSKDIHPRLLYRILTAKETLEEFQVQAETRSGTFPQITFDSISHLPIVLPPIEIQEAFQLAVGKMDAQIKVNKHQSRTLATLRDTLLPKLLSGELSVAEPEQ